MERLVDRGPPPAALRSARGGGVLLAGPEGLLARCRTSATRCSRRTSPASPAWCAPLSMPALENVALWHERDIIAFLGRTRVRPGRHRSTLDFALNAPDRPDRQAGSSIRKPCRPISTAIAAWCIRSACCWRSPKRARRREDSYQAVQRNAMKVWLRRQGFPDRAEGRCRRRRSR